VEGLCEEFGAPVRLAELGVPEDELESIATAAASAGSTRTNPLEMSAEAILDLMRKNL